MTGLLIKATFRGANESAGYEYDAEYELLIVSNSIHRMGNRGLYARVPYGSVEAFLRNWTDIRLLRRITI